MTCADTTATWTNVSADPSNNTNGTPPTAANLLATTGVSKNNNLTAGWAVGSGGTILSARPIAPANGGI